MKSGFWKGAMLYLCFNRILKVKEFLLILQFLAGDIVCSFVFYNRFIA